MTRPSKIKLSGMTHKVSDVQHMQSYNSAIDKCRAYYEGFLKELLVKFNDAPLSDTWWWNDTTTVYEEIQHSIGDEDEKTN